jgi:hypothetical protein
MKNNYIALCLFCKDENEYLEEWIDYHLSIGVNHIFIYDNMSHIPIAKTVEKYIKDGVVTVDTIADYKPGRHCRVFNQCINEHGHKYKWIGFIDTDEFIVVKSGNHNIVDFLKNYEDCAALGVYWLCFGSNGKIKKQNSQIKAYTKRSEKNFHANRHIKTIAQTKYIKNKVHTDPHSFVYKEGYYAVDENKNKIIGARGNHTTEKIQLNHYVLRSRDEFKNKIARGGGNSGEKGRKKMHFFTSYDNVCNNVTDNTINEIYK